MSADLTGLFASIWEFKADKGDIRAFLDLHPAATLVQRLQVILYDQRQRWKCGKPMPAEDYLKSFPELNADPQQKLQLVVGEFQASQDFGGTIAAADLAARFPELNELIPAELSRRGLTHWHPLPHVAYNSFFSDSTQNEHKSAGRYKLLELIGEGAFGQVWLAFDQDLRRRVAVKLAHPDRFPRPEDTEDLMREARVLAGLNHPNIVRVLDAGRSDGRVYIVCDFVDGKDLAKILKTRVLEFREAVELIATVAAALHYAHTKGLIHRDVKPSNLLIDETTQKAFVADFGLAVSETDYAETAKLAGTPGYMSPEQVRGESHRMDARCDVFALGAVFYELLTGTPAFRGSTKTQVLSQVVRAEPKPPRQVNGQVPAELERICLKALSKRAADRYLTAQEMVEDLQLWLTPADTLRSADQPVSMIPKGLRSFDGGDAHFFLDLLPGPRNRDGLPESIAFWKQRIEGSDPNQSFAVGLMYGPSGCGKSSLVKAGLLPRLSRNITVVYVEATADDTETRILQSLTQRLYDGRMRIRENSDDSGRDRDLGTSVTGLTEILADVRRETGTKVVIIIDQFEQWLHAHRTESAPELVTALRQCDGVRLQAIVMVRDDFWLAVSRFMDQIEVEPIPGVNVRLVDLFDADHAVKVLRRIGLAYQKLPATDADITTGQREFLTKATEGLAEDGRVVSVRLALFGEMVKGKPWQPETLADMGGTQGVGIAFLEETFSSRFANPKHRQHQPAAQAVLAALLPELGTDIKGHMRSQQKLQEAAGLQNRPNDFNDLLRILDSELRLITPTGPEGDSLRDPPHDSSLANRYYQLTHDYLVPSLREWLTRKQNETRRGRAELKLAERSAFWNAKPENRQLPSLLEWFRMRTLTDAKHWTLPQRTMMRKAARVHLLRWGGGLAMCLIVGLGIQQWLSALQRTGLQEQVVTAVDTVQNVHGAAIPFAIRDLRERYPAEMVTTELVTRFATEKDAHRKLGLAFALAEYGILHAEFLVSLIESVPGEDSRNIVHALRADREGSLEAMASAAAICTEQENWRLKARLAVAALGCGAPQIAADICQMDDRPDPIQRTIFIDQFPQWHGDLLILSQVTRTINDAALRSVLCLAVGSVPSEQVTQEERDAWEKLFSDWYQHQRDTGTHSASGWALRHWGIPLPPLPVGEPERNRGQDKDVARLAANVADLQQQVAEAEKAFPERQAAWNQQLQNHLASIAVVHGIQGFLCSSGLQAVITTDFYDGKNQELMLLHDLETGQRRVLCELGWDFVVSPGSNGLIAMKSSVRNPLQEEVQLFDPGTGATRSIGLGVCPSWNMNGTTLYFHDVTSEAVRSLNVNDSETVPEPLIGKIPASFVVVSPDATKVAYFLNDEIRVIDIATHKMIASYATSAWRGALLGWAPDSRHVGFGSHVVASGLWILDTETGECFMVVPGNATRPSWSRDGRRMLYEDRRERKIHVVAWSPEEQQALAEMNRGRVELTESIRQLQDRLTEMNATLSEAGWRRTCQWYVNCEGITMLCIPAGQFLNEAGATVKVKEGFLLSDREISFGQFQQFIDDQDYPHSEKPTDWASADKEDSPTSDHPVARVNWYDSVLYCNWLSAREGLAPAYERTGAKDKIGETEYDAWNLVEGGSGYRLPHEIEWEYACRAGTTTDFASGSDEEMLRSYAVILLSGTEIGARKLPNSWGLHDLHGNVSEWCDDGILRGGSFSARASNVRSSYRNSGQQDLRVNNVGFRVGRTLPPVPLALLPAAESESKLEN